MTKNIWNDMKIKTKPEWFIGRWETDSGVFLEIGKTPKGFRVRAFDKCDGEEFVVSKTAWDGKNLQFETFVPSTHYRTRNRLTLTSKRRLTQELTIFERWKKCGTRSANTEKAHGAATPKE